MWMIIFYERLMRNFHDSTIFSGNDNESFGHHLSY